MKKTLLFNSTAAEKRAALVEGGTLTELVVERPDNYRILGNVYRGLVHSILPGIQSAFVDLGDGNNGFLHGSDIDPTLLLEEDNALIERYTDRSVSSKRDRIVRIPIDKVLKKGQNILVQVVKEAIGSKSPKITTKISFAGRFIVLVPDMDFVRISRKSSDGKLKKELRRRIMEIKPPGVGFIVRTIGLQVSEEELINEMKYLIEQWERAQKEALSGEGPKLIFKETGITTQVIRDMFSKDIQKVIADQEDDYNEIVSYLKAIAPDLVDRVELYKDDIPLFDRYNIEKDAERSIKRKVWIKNGGYLFFDHAEALLAIDINTGRNVGKNDPEGTIFETNILAAEEICRQLRLRDIGGLIVVDFIDMLKNEHKKALEKKMMELLAMDPTTTSCTRLSKFGLMEITRKRVRPELQELYTNVCHACNGLGRVFSPATVTTRIDRWLRKASRDGFKSDVVIGVSESVEAYISSISYDIVSEMSNNHGINVKVETDSKLDQDEFEVTSGNKDNVITDKYL